MQEFEKTFLILMGYKNAWHLVLKMLSNYGINVIKENQQFSVISKRLEILRFAQNDS
jgi:hypothetical protein